MHSALRSHAGRPRSRSMEWSAERHHDVLAFLYRRRLGEVCMCHGGSERKTPTPFRMRPRRLTQCNIFGPNKAMHLGLSSVTFAFRVSDRNLLHIYPPCQNSLHIKQAGCNWCSFARLERSFYQWCCCRIFSFISWGCFLC